MRVSISREAFVFLCSAMSGAGLFLLYDLFRILRKTVGVGRLFTGIQDCLFWILSFIFMFCVIFYVNNGVVRFYEILGAILGAICYGFTLSAPILRILDAIIGIFSKFFKIFFKILLTPLTFAYNIINRYIYVALRPIRKLLRHWRRQILKHLKQTHRFIRKT